MEGSSFLVEFVYVGQDASNQIACRWKVTATDDLALQEIEEDLDEIEPRRVSGNGMEMHPGVSFAPVPAGHFSRTVAAYVVQNDMQLTIRIETEEAIHEGQEFAGAVTLLDLGRDCANVHL